MTHYVKWMVGLSDGSNIYEDKGDFKRVAGEKTPWLKLKKYLDDKGVEITSLSLYTDGGDRWVLPSSGSSPKFQELRDIKQPNSYKFRRKAKIEQSTGNTREYAVVIAEYDDYDIEIWVLEKEPNPSWSLIKQK